MVIKMEIISKDIIIDSMHRSEMIGSQADLYTCFFDNKKYVYKEPYDYSQNLIDLHERLSHIHNKKLILPQILVSEHGKIVAYLTRLSHFSPIFYLQNLSLKKKIDILNQAKKAIISMHQSHIIHCDLHTANIMYKGGKVEIIDFDSCVYGSNTPESLNKYAKNYLKINDISPSLDIFIFNISTISFLYNISFLDVFKFDFMCNLDGEKEEVWQKTKAKKELTYNDFLINYY